MSQTSPEWPDVRWGTLGNPLSRAASALASTKPGSWLVRCLVGLDRRVLQRTAGRRTMLGPIGAPLLLLVTTGRRSGRQVTTPLLYVRDGDRLVVVGSNFGQDHHPGWTANLLAQPDAAVIMAGTTIPVTAAPVTGTDKEQLYRRFVEITGAYAAYQRRTTRELRMFALTRR